MRLYERMAEPCRLLRRSEAADGEGGTAVEYVADAEFAAAIVKDSSSDGSQADKRGEEAAWTVTGTRPLALAYGDVIERADGSRLRVVSGQVVAPAMASFAFRRCKAVSFDG